MSGVYRGVIWLYGWYFIDGDIGRQGDDRLMMLLIDIDVMERGRMRREVQGSDRCSDKCSVGSRNEVRAGFDLHKI